MGIFCEISLFKASDGVYHPGQDVSGVIKYTLDKPMIVDKITTSLKGIGSIILRSNPGTKHERTYNTEEIYVDSDTIIQDEKTELAAGTHEIKFNYILPQNIPSSMNNRRYFSAYRVSCAIKYYIRIKFERPGLLAFNKHFRKEINVIAAVTPRFPREPMICGETKKLTKLFSSKDSVVDMKATILNAALPFNGRILVDYEVHNRSHVTIKSIVTQLVQAYIFKAKGHQKVKLEEVLPGTESKTTSIKCGETQNMTIDINAQPHGIYSLENAYIVNRCYAVRIIAELPLPHRNAVLDIPLQIGVLDENVEGNGSECLNDGVDYNDAPPSYWEAMGEAKKGDEFDIDDETDKIKQQNKEL